jgi:hypothetical protein
MLQDVLAPTRQVLVQTLRSDSALEALVPGDVHEGFAPPGTARPWMTYQVIYSPINYLWGSAITEIGIQVCVWATNSVDAHNIDALVLDLLHDAELQVDGQSTLICRRMSSLSLAHEDEEGKKIYQVGGTYEIWVDQPLPHTESGSFAADADLIV